MIMALTADIIKVLPKATGVYILRDASSRIIYIGKAKDLRIRLDLTSARITGFKPAG